MECPVCNKELDSHVVTCSKCNSQVHRACAKKRVGNWYCKSCFKDAKKDIQLEKMSQRAQTFGGKW